ncbi:MAG: beta-lactamase family protein, partial [Defluviitaleaceae bacterium]|nr:beta-lactamase family protein [Defluviitaleaceae bacterium]
ERAAYANNGTLLLGILVAEMSGFAENGDFFSGFSDFVSENILIPLGMNYATLHITPESYIAMPYIASFLPQEELLYVNPISVGGMFANAHDMSIYMHHILEQQRIENSPIWQMSQMQDFDFSLSQLQTGHGFHRMALPTVTVMGHDGGTPHFTTAMFFDFENGLGAFISTNGSAVGAGAVFELLDAILATAAFEKTGNLQNPPEPLPPGIPTELSTGELDLLEGYYSTFGWLILDDGVLRFPNVLGMFSAELSPFTDGSFGIFIEGEFVARLWFREINGNMAAFQGDRAETFATERIDVWEADENFERWIGDYNLRSSVPGNSPIAGETIAFGTDDNGLAFVSLLGSELPIIMVDDYTYFVSGRGRNLGGVIQFSVDADSGEIWVELIGGRFVR